MNRIIGLRVSPKKIFYSIIQIEDDCTFKLINQELILPVSFDTPQKFKYVRNTFLNIFNEYNIKKAGIRLSEPFSKNTDVFRIMLEGIIQELIASSKVVSYFYGAKSSMSSKLGIKNDGTLTEMIDGNTIFKNIENWSNISKEHRESILVAFASLN